MYCITLRSRVDARITGWFDGSDSRWSTDYKRQKLFDKKRDARSVCQELRELCPRNAKFINVEAVYDIALDGRRSDPRDLGELSYERVCTLQVVGAGSSSSPRVGDTLDGAWVFESAADSVPESGKPSSRQLSIPPLSTEMSATPAFRN